MTCIPSICSSDLASRKSGPPSRPIWPVNEKYNVKEYTTRIEAAWDQLGDVGQRRRGGLGQTLAKSGFVNANVVKIISGPNWLSYILLIFLGGVLLFSFLILVITFFLPDQATAWGDTKDLLQFVIPTLTTLVGSTIGFYFGSQTQKSD